MQNVKKSLSIKILASFTLLFLLISIFSNFIERKDKIQDVFASDTVDVTYTFSGSNTLTFPTYFKSSDAYSSFLPFNFRVDFYSLAGVTYVQPDCSYYTGSGTEVAFHNTICSNSYSGSQITTFTLNGNSTIIYCAESVSSLRNGAFKFGVKADSGFNSNVYKIRMYLPTSYEIISAGFAKPLHIVYYDVNDKRLIFEFSVQNSFVFNDRSYYILQDLDDNVLYNEGYDAGYNAGITDGNSSGYKNGYDIGLTEGYNIGYSYGVENGSKYTFTNLLGAVIDVPVRTFTSLFNFELLGVNLAGFFSGLLTLAVILTIVRLIKGG